MFYGYTLSKKLSLIPTFSSKSKEISEKNNLSLEGSYPMLIHIMKIDPNKMIITRLPYFSLNLLYSLLVHVKAKCLSPGSVVERR